MTFDCKFVMNSPADDALLIDHKRGAPRQGNNPSQPHYPIRSADAPVTIADQQKRKAVASSEASLGFRRVAADGDDDSMATLEFVKPVSVAAELPGAAPAEIPGIEGQYDVVVMAELRQGDHAAPGDLGREVGGR